MPQLTTTLPSLISFDLYSYFGHVPIVLKVKHDNLVYMENNRIPLWFSHSENTHAIAADIMPEQPCFTVAAGTETQAVTGDIIEDNQRTAV